MNLTQDEARQLFLDAAAALTPPPPAPPLALNAVGLTVIPGDVYVPPGVRTVRVPVSLSAVPNQTTVFRWGTSNGTIYQGPWFDSQSGWITFHPGEQFKTVTITTKKDLLPGNNFKVVWTTTSPGSSAPLALTPAPNYSLVHGDVAGPNAKVTPVSAALPSRPTGLKLVLNETFGPNWTANEDAILPDGTPCWRSRLGHGRTQQGNKETGWYSDPVLNPGTTPWTRDVDGKLQLQLEYHPDGVKNADGTLNYYAWNYPNTPQFFQYSSSVISTQRLPIDILPGSYVEARFKLEIKRGSWPAFWLLSKDFGTWPLFEADILEGFFGGNNNVSTGSHYKTATGGHAVYGTSIPNSVTNINFFTDFHTYGFHWGEKFITYYLDDQPYMIHPASIWPTNKPAFIMLNITTGGLVGPVVDNGTLPVKMTVDWVKVWQ